MKLTTALAQINTRLPLLRDERTELVKRELDRIIGMGDQADG